MKKIAGVAAFIASVLGVGVFFYLQKKPETAISQEPISQEPTKTAEPTTPSDQELPAASMPAPSMEEPQEAARPTKDQRNRAGKGHFEVSALRMDSLSPADQQLFGKAREQKLWDIFRQKGSDLARFVKVLSLKCKGIVCTVEAESKDRDMDHFQSLIFAIIEDHPWVGNKIDVTTLNDAGTKARFIFIHESAK